MLRRKEEKMKSERETDNFSGERINHHNINNNNHNHNYYTQQQQQQLFENGVSSSENGYYFNDVASSSSVSPFDHNNNNNHNSVYPTQKAHFVDQYFVGSNLPDSYYRRSNNGGVLMDEVGLAREFQKMDIIGNTTTTSTSNSNNHRIMSSDVVARDSDLFRRNDCNVPEFTPSFDENFGVFEGFVNHGGFYRDDKGVKDERGFRLGGQRGVGDSLGLNSGYGVHGQQNCLINFPLDGSVHQGDEGFGNGGSIGRGNRGYDRMQVYDSDGFVGNGGSVPRGLAAEYLSSGGGVIPRGDVGYGGEIPVPLESPYGLPSHSGQYMMDGYKEMLSSWGSSQDLAMYKHLLNNEAAFLEQYERQFCGNVGGLNSVDPSQLMYSKQALGRGNNVLYNSMREKMRAIELREGASAAALMKRNRHLESLGCEGRVISEKGLNGAMGKNCQLGRTKKMLSGSALQNIGERNFGLNSPLQTESACENGGRGMMGYDPVFMQTLFNAVDVRGNIFLMAKDQHGCRFLQKKFDDGSFDDVQLIFDEIIEHVVELMVNPFGNYLIQKLLDVCNEEQRMKIVHVVTKTRGELVKISLNSHGTRVVQKLIESLKTRKQISMVIRALEPGFLDLMRDLNGNHVVQRCLHCLSSEDNKFIFDAAAMHCVEIATQRHGCCVLQRCIDHSSGEHWQKLIDKICSNALVLAQDPFGNYVVQYVIERKIPSAKLKLISQFEGNYVLLSTQKFSSHVVEKCLNYIEESHPRIVCELLSVPHFDQLVQDPFANYVLQSALEKTKGAVYESLVLAIRPHSMLRTNPYCKKIFSRGLLKK